MKVDNSSGMSVRQNIQDADFFGVGSYTVGEAARLIGTSALNISRWMKGYTSAAKKLSIDRAAMVIAVADHRQSSRDRIP
ncbi:hypothetical protein [Mesorhizobium sp. M0478]|uniref:hypothetical protein n=1 Tax=Mesorhizobium sp. M0478 TaxID=2956947 RepID=UPI00333B43D7